jgi:hypothetical protein
MALTDIDWKETLSFRTGGQMKRASFPCKTRFNKHRPDDPQWYCYNERASFAIPGAHTFRTLYLIDIKE